MLMFGAVFVSSILSILACVLISGKSKKSLAIQKLLVPFAAGAMLATVFVDLFPEAVEAANEAQIHNIFYAAMFGLVGFFLLETVIHNFHHHPESESGENKKEHTANLVVIGGILHTILDGIVIGLAFLADSHVGIITTFAILAHKIPQEIGNFGIILKEKKKKTALILISAVSFSSLIGAGLVFLIGSELERFLPEMLGLTAGFFLYIAVSDIMPSIHKSKNRNWQIFAFIFGLILISGLIYFSHLAAH